MVAEDTEFKPTPEQKKKQTKIAGLTETNLKMIEALKQVGGNVDLAAPRVEHLMGFLVDEGILTPDQVFDERIQWELRLRTELQPIYERIKTVHRMQGGNMQTESGLIVPGKGHTGG